MLGLFWGGALLIYFHWWFSSSTIRDTDVTIKDRFRFSPTVTVLKEAAIAHQWLVASLNTSLRSVTSSERRLPRSLLISILCAHVLQWNNHTLLFGLQRQMPGHDVESGFRGPSDKVEAEGLGPTWILTEPECSTFLFRQKAVFLPASRNTCTATFAPKKSFV